MNGTIADVAASLAPSLADTDDRLQALASTQQ